MSNYPVGRPPRTADPQSKLRLAALTAVIAGVVLLAAAAFVLSYSGIHEVALQAGVSPSLAKLYPVIFDAMLVVAGAAAMALRGAGWWSRFYAWACLIVLLAAVAVGDAVHATNTTLPERATRAVVAITPWVLLLLAFGLLLTMLRHFRKARATVVARQEARAAAAGDAGTTGQPAEANGTAPGRSAVSWTAASASGTAEGTAGGVSAGAEGRALPQPLSALDMLLGPRPGQAPAIEAPHDAGIDDEDSQSDPVSYGEETGYVHPDSYRDEGEYSPHGDSGGPGGYTGYLGQDEPAGNGDATAQRNTAAGNRAGDGAADAGAQPGEPGQAAPAGPAGAGAQPAQAGSAAQAAQAEVGQADAAGPAGAGAQPGQAGGAAQAGQAGGAAQAAQAGQAETGQADGAAQAGQAQAGQPEAAANSVPAGDQARDEASAEPAAAQGPGLERMRSTPTRPEE